MPAPRIVELCAEAVDHAIEAVGQLDEFEESRHRHGHGVHRDPTNILIDLREELHDLLATMREACDELERAARL